MPENQSPADSGSSWGKVSSVLGIVTGVLILALALYWTGFSNVTRAFAKGGPALLFLVLFYPIELVSRAYGWQFVYPAVQKPSTVLFITGMWFAQSINRLLPTATIGGDIIRGRFLTLKGRDKTKVISSLIADKTGHAVATVVILILGLGLIFLKPTSTQLKIILPVISVILGILTYIFIRLQRSSGVSKLLKKWGSDGGFLSIANEKAREIEDQLNHIYAHPRSFIISISIRVAGDIALAAEVWVAARLLGTPISILDAITLRLVAFGIRSVAFVIWGGIGVQESAYALLSAFIGLPPAALIAISLATRVREIMAAVPGVIFWMGDEGYEVYKKSISSS